MMKFEPSDSICCPTDSRAPDAERRDGDDGRDADEDAEHRERRAQQVAPDRAERDADRR